MLYKDKYLNKIVINKFHILAYMVSEGKVKHLQIVN